MLAEAENERMHLMFFIEIAKPNWFERRLVLVAQFIFSIFYFLMFILFPRTSHRMIAYFEEEAVKSYNEYLELVENGIVENIPAPKIAIDYYKMKQDAKLSDLITNVRNDEIHHSETNHKFSDLDDNEIFADKKNLSLANIIKSQNFSEKIIEMGISKKN